MMSSNGPSSRSGRLRLSVDSSHSVTTSVPTSSHQPSSGSMFAAPASWPSAVSRPTARAQRRLPSSITPMCLGRFSDGIRRSIRAS